MTDKPIIFSAPMVRALLDGRKTQTRRVVKRPTYEYGGKWWVVDRVSGDCELEDWAGDRVGVGPPYAIGDRLWVREAFSYDRLDVDRDGTLPPWFWADGNPDSGDWTPPKPSIHMPRWASRITLTVTEVRVQRLQRITGRDIIAEGVRCEGCYDVGAGHSACRDGGCFAARSDFSQLWNSIHGPGAWDENPWVVALTFTVRKGNIDG